MQPEILFPIDQPVMPEARQIGRRPMIELLEKTLASPSHTWLIGERRIGKTSVAKAVLARSRGAGGIALDVDLSRPGIDSPEALAGDIARQAQAAAAGAESTAQRIGRFTRGRRNQVKGLGEALKGLGFEDAAAALSATSAILASADDGAPGLDKTLQALALHARATEHRVWLLLDEVHLLGNLDSAEQTVAHWCHEHGSPLVFLFAGSEESAARELREPGRPLNAVGEEFKLIEIAFEDWLAGLRARFEEAGVKIADGEIFTLLQASDGHPRRTMMIASRVNHSVASQPDRRADATLVELAIHDAKRDRSWR
ncbi:MAG TPA: hypothetical protein VH268_11345 [Solirubrobacterales bacterium]|nr:hypothetical protein [Solirubrobacterales bacterium]